MRNKVTVVGAGNVGSSCALWLAQRDLADIVLVDIPQAETMPTGKGLDLLQAGPIVGYNSRVVGNAHGSYDGTENSDIIIITAGVPRKPGMSREDLVGVNQAAITDVIDKALPRSPQAVLIVVTNPLDTMTYLALKHSKLPKQRGVGQAGILASARFAAFVAQALDVSIENVQTVVLGGHGDEMVPLTRYSTVFGVPLSEWLPADRLQALVDRTRKGGAEIVGLLKTGSAYYAPSAAVVDMVDAIVYDKKKIISCSVFLQGEYGIDGLFVGVPVKLGARGVEEIVELKLQDDERGALTRSAGAVRELIKVMKIE